MTTSPVECAHVGDHPVSSLLACYEQFCQRAKKQIDAYETIHAEQGRMQRIERNAKYSPGYKPKNSNGRKVSWKLTDAQKEEIQKLAAGGMPFRAIGRMFRVSGHIAHYWAKKVRAA